MSDIETYTFTGRQVQEIVDGLGKLQGSLRIAMRRVRGSGENFDEKREAIRARQAEVDAIIAMLMSPKAAS